LKRHIVLIALLVTVTAVAAQQAPEHILVNSRNWQDVYSGMLYAELRDTPGNFLTSTNHATSILNDIDENKDYIQAVSSENPYIVGYEDILLSRGFGASEELVLDNVNLDLARQLDTQRFIVVDGSYGYNALSAAPYAARAGYYVLFANEITIDQVTDFLQERGVEDLIILGHVDRSVNDQLAQFNPEIIDEGGRFANNIAMAQRYLDDYSAEQVQLTNGEFLEASLISGQDPVLFIGRERVPDQVRSFIEQSDIQVGILVGNELVGSATFIRRQLGISVFVKFARGSREPTGPVASVEDLDRFALPKYNLDLTVEDVTYNQATQDLEVRYRNNADIATYFRSTITVQAPNQTASAGDNQTQFIGRSEVRTLTYDTDVPPAANASIFTIYGDAANSMDEEFEATYPINYVTIEDDARLMITDAVYNGEAFEVTVENPGSVETFVDLDIVDLRINEETVTRGTQDVASVEAGSDTTIPVEVAMTDADIEENPEITVRARFGERELALIKQATATFEFKERSADYVTYALIALIIILIALIIRKKRQER
jgi:hypothetical protein